MNFKGLDGVLKQKIDVEAIHNYTCINAVVGVQIFVDITASNNAVVNPVVFISILFKS